MQIITNEIHDNKFLQLSSYYQPEEVVVFDIETTGFAAAATTLYLIGCCFYQDGKWMITQWFNDDAASEREILTCFMEFVARHKYLLHYNGDGFDIPYVAKKLEAYGLNYNFETIESIDLYKQIRPFRHILHLDNLKQKSLEQFLEINRLDKYTGGDLIKVYKEYMKNPTDAGMKLLIQHNYEDLEGLLYCCCLLSYPKLKAGCFHIEKMSVREEHLVFSLALDYPLPKRIAAGIHDIIITGYENEASLRVPILQEEMKFFLENYKEYYYLPAEDVAVHKSVASYVDRNYREQAKKENCYLRRQGYFITQLDEGILAGYKREYDAHETFIELTDSFLQDAGLLASYTKYIIYKGLNGV